MRNPFLNSFNKKSKYRNLFLQNSRYNPLSTMDSFITNKSLMYSLRETKYNIDYLKQKYGYVNYTSSSDANEKINEIKSKYFFNTNFSSKNLRIESQSITIGNNNNNKKRNRSCLSLSFNEWEKMLTQQQKLHFENNIKDKLFGKEKNKQMSDLVGDDFFDKNKEKLTSNLKNNKVINENNNLNNEFNKNKNCNNDTINNIDFEESLNIQNPLKNVRNIFPISSRIKLLKEIKKNIDTFSKEAKKTNISLNLSKTTYLNLSTTMNLSSRNSNFTPIQTLIRSHSKPKPKIPTYKEFMSNEHYKDLIYINK